MGRHKLSHQQPQDEEPVTRGLPALKQGEEEKYGGKITRVKNGYIAENSRTNEVTVWEEKTIEIAIQYLVLNRTKDMLPGDVLEFEIKNTYTVKKENNEDNVSTTQQ